MIRTVVVAIVVVRLAAAIWAALSNTHGDYYAAMPGAYVRTVNPTLWDSPDLQGTWGYHVETYFHGPTQYLTLYPVAFLDSYAHIAQVLLPIYLAVLALTFVVLRMSLLRLAPGLSITVPLFASTFLFFPLLQALIQREFEVVMTLALAAALWCSITDRRAAAGALFGYVTWFKYVPLLFAGYLALRWWWAALAAFVIASLLILGVSHWLFDLALFVNNNVPGHAMQVFNLTSSGFAIENGFLHGTGFCAGWFEGETTLANVRHGLCTLAFRTGWLPPHLVYIAICLAVAVSYMRTHWKLAAARLAAGVESWRRALECAIVITVCACFFFAHYYYLIVLVIPYAVLLARQLSARRRIELALGGLSYALVSAFVIPTGILTRLLGVDVWFVFINSAAFLFGELLLMVLLLREYRHLTEET